MDLHEGIVESCSKNKNMYMSGCDLAEVKYHEWVADLGIPLV